MNTTLIIMAAGIGSRFGTGIKQLASLSILFCPLKTYAFSSATAAKNGTSHFATEPIFIRYSVFIIPPRGLS